ncbi:MAG: LysM peptidoglycan-binding domain-containing protein [Minicystis sp.]
MRSIPASHVLLGSLALSALLPGVAAAQSADDGGQQGGPPVTVIQVPAAQPAGPSYPGSLPPAGYNPDSHLPSSSQSVTDINKGDGFDLRAGKGGPASVRGGAGGQFVSEGTFTPQAHTVRRGDTLWEISSRYYQNPYAWPRLWGYNAQIQNPHWIYPGDRVRLRDPSVAGSASTLGMGNRRAVPPATVFLRDVGWVDDKKDDTWGEVVGSPSDRMMLGDGDDLYIQIEDGHEVSLGEELTIFRPIRTVESDNAKGEMVSIRGTAKIERYNPKTKMVRAKIIEALDVIERGAKVGPVGRKFDVVPPIRSDIDLEVSILASVYPNHFYGQHQVVFVDRGDKDGLKPGMRIFAVMRGDRWQQSLGTIGSVGKLRPRVEDDRPAKVDDHVTDSADDNKLPDETYAELRVMRVREHTATAIVVQARYEVERNARLVVRKGY